MKITTSIPQKNIDKEKFIEALEKYKQSKTFGYLTHSGDTQLYNKLEDIACEYTSLETIDDNLVADINITNTPNGKLFQKLLDSHISFGLAPKMVKYPNGDLIILSIDLIPKDLKQNDIEIKQFISCFKTKDSDKIFLEGCCYWFAFILYSRFILNGYNCELMYNQIDGHFATKINGKLYDITGEIEITDNWQNWSKFYNEEPSYSAVVIRDSIMKSFKTKEECKEMYDKYMK